MRKILAIIIVSTLISSCGSYLDYGNDIHTEYMDFNYMEKYNEFIYKSKINASAGSKVYYTTHFSVNLPKKIKNWQSSSNEFFFEYDGKEIIYINSGYKNKGEAGKWTMRETNGDEIYKKLSSYWDKRKYDENSLNGSKSGRASKVYSDGKALILLYNVKEKNFEKYLELVKSFKYID
ncbi:hypothetical protein GGR22_001293 [Flavobacterium gossypii]|uniref:DUF4367 domain-containing protein n=1 Tax=Flavobacterium gossypii TaxID=1646119 RepID=A0ABR6DN96_9FLAO|nr:hypothetical protein [Flavobacterium gossypii]MBA9073167.1 hypothetical protein [Flavobacterium gossypii]